MHLAISSSRSAGLVLIGRTVETPSIGVHCPVHLAEQMASTSANVSYLARIGRRACWNEVWAGTAPAERSHFLVDESQRRPLVRIV